MGFLRSGGGSGCDEHRGLMEDPSQIASVVRRPSPPSYSSTKRLACERGWVRHPAQTSVSPIFQRTTGRRVTRRQTSVYAGTGALGNHTRVRTSITHRPMLRLRPACTAANHWRPTCKSLPDRFQDYCFPASALGTSSIWGKGYEGLSPCRPSGRLRTITPVPTIETL